MSSSTERNRRVLMIGLDSADIDYLLSIEHALPNFRALRESGRFERLSSPAEYMSASSWPTFYSGQDPGEHGVYFPMQWDAESMKLRRLWDDWAYVEPFWYELSRAGHPVVTIDVPMAFSSRIPNGLEVVNWGAQSYTNFQSDANDLGREIKRRYGRHPMSKSKDKPTPKTRKDMLSIKNSVIEGVALKADMTKWLMSKTDWDMFLVVFSECHRAGHYVWPDEGGLPEQDLIDVFQKIDGVIGDLINQIDIEMTSVIVFSPLGMGRNYTQMHHLHGIIDRINAKFSEEVLGNPPAAAQGSNLMRTLRRMVPGQIQAAIVDLVPDSVRDWVVSREFVGGYDWSSTPGFPMPGGREGYIRFNLRGREKRGLLDPHGNEFAVYRDWIKKGFESLRTAGTNEPVASSVSFIQEVYGGAKSSYLPDVVVNWNCVEPASILTSDWLGNFQADFSLGRSGNHRGDGFALVSGGTPESIMQRPLGKVTDLSNMVRDLVA